MVLCAKCLWKHVSTNIFFDVKILKYENVSVNREKRNCLYIFFFDTYGRFGFIQKRWDFSNHNVNFINIIC